MSELARNRRNGLTVADTGDIDLSVENGTITDSNGKSVTIGTSYNEIERSFGKEDAAVTHVKGDTPTGDLRVAESGNIVVDGYGSVSLVGSRNEVSTVTGRDGNGGSLQTQSDGTVELEYVSSGREVKEFFEVREETDSVPPKEITTDPSSIDLLGFEQSNIDLIHRVSDNEGESAYVYLKATNTATGDVYGPKETSNSNGTADVEVSLTANEIENDAFDIITNGTDPDSATGDSWVRNSGSTLQYANLLLDYNYEEYVRMPVAIE